VSRAQASGFVLAGGRSRRMGRDKALLPWKDATLLDHALRRLERVAADVHVLCGPRPRYADHGAPLVLDGSRDGGALVGVLAGLGALRRPLGVFLAVDLPWLPPELLERLVELADGYDAVLPVTARGHEPLAAVYARSCLAPVRDRVRRGALKLTGFLDELRVREVGEAELRPYGAPERIFANLNAPEDYAAARELRAR
jgi:molybdopterin-guanine dinucleotide biosynthesis protein A